MGEVGKGFGIDVWVGVECICCSLFKLMCDVFVIWVELLSDRVVFGEGVERFVLGSFMFGEFDCVVVWCGVRGGEIVGEIEFC